MLLTDKVAIVTGGAMGNGQAMALGLAAEGANLVVVDIDLTLAEETGQQVRALGRRALAVRTDVANKADVEEMVRQTLAEFGRVDTLVNNAGVTSRYDLLELPEAE